LGKNVFLVRFLACDTLLPTSRVLPVSSQIRDIVKVQFLVIE